MDRESDLSSLCTEIGDNRTFCLFWIVAFQSAVAGIWNGGLSDEVVEEMANSNLHVMRFLGLSLEDEVPDHSVLSR
ncbi:MAG: transposase [Nitrosomonas sp.]|nr:transposase [Nitrosomonas sp.]MBP6076706.1 transposase [Nitrosomonas sp.]